MILLKAVDIFDPSLMQLTVCYKGTNGAEEVAQADVDPGSTYSIDAKEKNEGIGLMCRRVCSRLLSMPSSFTVCLLLFKRNGLNFALTRQALGSR